MSIPSNRRILISGVVASAVPRPTLLLALTSLLTAGCGTTTRRLESPPPRAQTSPRTPGGSACSNITATIEVPFLRLPRGFASGVRWASRREVMLASDPAATWRDRPSPSQCAVEAPASYSPHDLCVGDYPLFGGSSGDLVEIVLWPSEHSINPRIAFSASVWSPEGRTVQEVWREFTTPALSVDSGSFDVTDDIALLRTQIASARIVADRYDITYSFTNVGNAPMLLCALLQERVQVEHEGTVYYSGGGSFAARRRADGTRGPEEPDCQRLPLQVIPPRGVAFRHAIHCPVEPLDGEFRVHLRVWITSLGQDRQPVVDETLTAVIGGGRRE